MINLLIARIWPRFHLGDYQGALSDYTRTLELDPKMQETYLHRAELWEKLGHPQKAAEDRRRAKILKTGI